MTISFAPPYALARPFLFGLDPEAAHDLTMASVAKMQRSPLRALLAQPKIADPSAIAGLSFPNRVGLAAGLDKNARCIDGFAAMGFGFIEVGTVTPMGQAGNPKPRMFRLPKAQALINRLGFNNDGLGAFLEHVKQSRLYGHQAPARGAQAAAKNCPTDANWRPLIGLNIGKNAATPMERATDDYLTCLDGVYEHADYITVNISSPNTKNLRDLQSDAALDALLGALSERRAQLAQRLGAAKPIFLKIAPDLEPAQIALIAATLRRYGCNASGVANNTWGLLATNTTVSRTAVAGMTHALELGGLSGAPVFEMSNAVIASMRQLLGAGFPIIGVGGILSADDAQTKLAAGADAVQIYTGLIYAGPALVTQIARRLAAARA